MNIPEICSPLRLAALSLGLLALAGCDDASFGPPASPETNSAAMQTFITACLGTAPGFEGGSAALVAAGVPPFRGAMGNNKPPVGRTAFPEKEGTPLDKHEERASCEVMIQGDVAQEAQARLVQALAGRGAPFQHPMNMTISFDDWSTWHGATTRFVRGYAVGDSVLGVYVATTNDDKMGTLTFLKVARFAR